VRRTIEAMKGQVRAGVTTAELDEIGARVMRRHGARSAPSLVHGFHGVSCISVNEEAVHGAPSGRALCDGDLVKLDATVEKDGFMADAAETIAVGRAPQELLSLIACAERAFAQAASVARAGTCVREIGRTVEREVRSSHFSVVHELGGHGIDRTIHEEPSVPNFDDPAANQILTAGLVITMEPIIAVGSGSVVLGQDGWTVSTADRRHSGALRAQLVVTDRQPILLTV
jgi:methionyl aminopeptidase